VATALLKIEPKMRKIKGYNYLRELRKAMESLPDQRNRESQVA